MKLFPLSILCLSSCISLPTTLPDLERGACVVTFSDREICTEMTLLACFDIEGKYDGDGSICGSLPPDFHSITVEPTPLYLDQMAISAVGGALTVLVGLMARNVMRRRKRGK